MPRRIADLIEALHAGGADPGEVFRAHDSTLIGWP
jgi:hypothetical protein